MAHTLASSVTETGTKVITPKRAAIEIYIDINPAHTLSARFYYADYNEEVVTPAGGSPTTNYTEVTPVGSVEITAAELLAYPNFSELYAYLKNLANAKALLQWPELSQTQTS